MQTVSGTTACNTKTNATVKICSTNTTESSEHLWTQQIEEDIKDEADLHSVEQVSEMDISLHVLYPTK